MIKPFFLILFCYCSILLPAQTILPGGVKGAKVWLKTNIKERHTPVWENQLTIDNFPIKQVDKTTTYINHNPVLSLDASKIVVAPLLENTNLAQATIFTVYQASGQEKILWHLVENGNSTIVLTTHRLSDLSNYDYLNFAKIQPNVPTINSYFHHSGENKTGVKSHLQLAHLPKDQSLPIQAFSGGLAEIIVFDRVLDEEDRLKVASYLAIKYGLTIQNSSKQYLNSTGEIIWKTDAEQTNFHRITGIGRDDQTQLHQIKSTSSYDPNFLSIGFTQSIEKPLAIPDQTFLLFGDNDAALTFAKINRFQAKLLNRHWQIQTTGKTNQLPTTLTFNPKSFHIQPMENETFWLVIDSTANGKFQTENLQYFPLSDRSSKSALIFDEIVWDIDKSNKDGFTIAIGPKVLTELSLEELAALHQKGEPLTQPTIPQFDVYPNPSADGIFQVKIRPNTLEEITLKVHNALGQEIFQQSFAGKEYYFYENQLTGTGIYILTVTESNQIFSRKLVVDRKK